MSFSFKTYHNHILSHSEKCLQKEIFYSFLGTTQEEENRASQNIQTHIQDFQDILYYSTLNGGKRLRFLLVCAVADIYNISLDIAEKPATAVELIHCYSLIHDDLPAMDNDTMRRGKLTTHKKFGEANAILAGSTLLTLAFEVLNRDDNGLTDWQTRRLSTLLARTSGNRGIVMGQYLDINTHKNTLDSLQTHKINALKTGELFRFSVISALLLNKNYSSQEERSLTEYAHYLGQLFQTLDDLDDLDDIDKNYPSLNEENHIDEILKTKKICANLAINAHKSLEYYGKKANMLHNLIDFLLEKNKIVT